MFANELTREQDIKPASKYETIIVTTEGKVGLIEMDAVAENRAVAGETEMGIDVDIALVRRE